ILAETDGSGRVAGPLCGDWLWGAASFPSVLGKGAVFSCFSSPPLLDPNPLGAIIDTAFLVLRIRPERFNGTRAETSPPRLSNFQPQASNLQNPNSATNRICAGEWYAKTTARSGGRRPWQTSIESFRTPA